MSTIQLNGIPTIFLLIIYFRLNKSPLWAQPARGLGQMALLSPPPFTIRAWPWLLIRALSNVLSFVKTQRFESGSIH
jgi:hypothetical protein